MDNFKFNTVEEAIEAIKNGKKCRINIWSGASVGPEIEEELAAVGGVKSRMPYYAASNKSMRAGKRYCTSIAKNQNA